MRLLLDTHAFLWWVSNDRRLPARARAAIAKREAECFVSLATCWEMAVKVSLNKLALSDTLDRFVPAELAANSFELLPISFAHVAVIARLPFHHRDPFDRLLIAQALTDDLTLVSGDPVARRYGVKTVW